MKSRIRQPRQQRMFLLLFSLWLVTSSASAFESICKSPVIRGAAALEDFSFYEGSLFAEDVLTAVFDLDHDGDQDIVLLGAFYPYQGEWDDKPREGRILINDGDLNFSEAVGDRPLTVHPREVLYADFDSNGLVDFFVADHGYDAPPFPGYRNTLMLQFEDGWVDASDRLPIDPNGFTHNAAIGDVDDDGDIDIFVLNNGFQEVDNIKYLALNDGQGHFEIDYDLMPKSLPTGGTYSSHWDAWATAFADFDNDGLLDLVVGGDSARSMDRVVTRIYWGSEDGFSDDKVTLLETVSAPELTSVITIAADDINNDGRKDLLLGGSESEGFIELWMNAGNQIFLDQTKQRLSSDTNRDCCSGVYLDFLWLDFNSDGLKDIVPLFGGNLDRDSEIFAWLGDGSGYFSPVYGADFESGENYQLANPYILHDGRQHSVRFFSFEGALVANAAAVAGSMELQRSPCPLSVLPPLTPIQKVGLEEELLP